MKERKKGSGDLLELWLEQLDCVAIVEVEMTAVRTEGRLTLGLQEVPSQKSLGVWCVRV